MVDGVALSPHVEDLFGVVYHGRPHPIRSFWGWKGGLSDFERFDTKANKMIHPLVRQGGVSTASGQEPLRVQWVVGGGVSCSFAAEMKTL